MFIPDAVYTFLVPDPMHDDSFQAQSFVIAYKPSLLPTRTIIYPRAHYYNALTEGIIAIDRTWGSRGPVQSTRLSQVTTGPPKR